MFSPCRCGGSGQPCAFKLAHVGVLTQSLTQLQFAIVCKGHCTGSCRSGHGRIEMVLRIVGVGVGRGMVVAGRVRHVIV